MKAILAEAEPAGGRALITAITMENHGPWGAGRFPDEADPSPPIPSAPPQRRRGNQPSVEGLGRAARSHAALPFGDHPPILPGVVPTREAETDYAILYLQDGEPVGSGKALPMTADALGRLLGRLCEASGTAWRDAAA
jgi:hypothetical protein